MIKIDLKKASIYRRGVSFVIDEFITAVIRCVILIFIYLVFFRQEVDYVSEDLKSQLLSLPNKATLTDVINVFKAVRITTWMIYFTISFLIVPPIYQFCLYKYYNGMTIGKKFMKCIVRSENGTKMTTADIISRIAISYMPWLLPIIIYHFYLDDNILWIPCLAIWFFWYDPWILFGKKNRTLHDLLSGTAVFIHDNKEKLDL